jgi:hypothetical protein
MISMRKHRIPRWMNVVWLVFVFGLTFSFLRVAIRRGYDFVATVGFLFGNFGLIFGLAVIAGLALYGLSILLEGIDIHNSHDDHNDHSGDMANQQLINMQQWSSPLQSQRPIAPPALSPQRSWPQSWHPPRSQP